jgi:hypothetical protein
MVKSLGPSTSCTSADALDARISPRVAQEPATLRITVEVEPHVLNRYVVVQADKELFSRSSLIQLDGTASARVHHVLYRELPAGQYVVGVKLFSPTGIRASEHSDVIVVAMGSEARGR